MSKNKFKKFGEVLKDHWSFKAVKTIQSLDTDVNKKCVTLCYKYSLKKWMENLSIEKKQSFNHQSVQIQSINLDNQGR